MDESLPLFPLTTALVPGLVLPLHIFEPRYRMMVEELLVQAAVVHLTMVTHRLHQVQLRMVIT